MLPHLLLFCPLLQHSRSWFIAIGLSETSSVGKDISSSCALPLERLRPSPLLMPGRLQLPADRFSHRLDCQDLVPRSGRRLKVPLMVASQ